MSNTYSGSLISHTLSTSVFPVHTICQAFSLGAWGLVINRTNKILDFVELPLWPDEVEKWEQSFRDR